MADTSAQGTSPPYSCSIVADTPVMVTLDELRPYELNPRLTRNPLFDEIKSSIRERGLDAPLSITRRPDTDHYIIRNGGNTRLAILNELWTETRDERFFRLHCLFRPWPERGEIIALTGHLAENELRGALSFIERALGVEKARELYEQEESKSLSQSELARRLRADGYPVPQPHISRMQEAIQYLLPAIPTILYGGMGRHQIEQLTGLRRAGERIWDNYAAKSNANIEFPVLFQDVLTLFDNNPASFTFRRLQDELTGQMAELLGVHYDTMMFEITDVEKRWQVLQNEPVDTLSMPLTDTSAPPVTTQLPLTPGSRSEKISSQVNASQSPLQLSETDEQENEEDITLVQQHIISSVAPAGRLQSIQHLIADHLSETPPPFDNQVLQTILVQADGLYPITDIWSIDPGLDDPERLRIHIAQFAREIAHEAELSDQVIPCEQGNGFTCLIDSDQVITTSATPCPRTLLTLLHTLSIHEQPPTIPLDPTHFVAGLGPLLQGHDRCPRLSDNGLVKLFRLVRLTRRLRDITNGDSALPEL